MKVSQMVYQKFLLLNMDPTIETAARNLCYTFCLASYIKIWSSNALIMDPLRCFVRAFPLFIIEPTIRLGLGQRNLQDVRHCCNEVELYDYELRLEKIGHKTFKKPENQHELHVLV